MHFPDSIVLPGISVLHVGDSSPSFTGVLLPIDAILAAIVAASCISSAGAKSLTTQPYVNILAIFSNGLLETNCEPQVEIGTEYLRAADLVSGGIQHAEIAVEQ